MSVSKTGKPPSFSTISISFPVLTVLENDAAKGKTWETTEYKLSKVIIQNHFYSTYAVPPIAEGSRNQEKKSHKISSVEPLFPGDELIVHNVEVLPTSWDTKHNDHWH